jgi:hypothetical protein
MYRILFFALMLFVLPACEESNNTSSDPVYYNDTYEVESDCVNYVEGDEISVTTICEKIQCDCGGWGWDDVAHCETGFMGNTTAGSRCSNEEGYFICAAYCIPQNCTGFEACEDACWEEFCR